MLLRRGSALEGYTTILLAIFAVLGIMFLIGIPGRRRTRRLHESTLYGEALVRNVTAENVNSSGPRFVRYDVTIVVAGKKPYDAHTSVMTAITEMPALSIGRTFPVQIDPQDPGHFRFAKQ